MKALPADICVSYDTTGSMYPCLTQVRRVVESLTKQLFKELPDLRMSIITHGDYCDGARAINILDFTTNQDAICDFIKKAPATGGGDSPECYELVLNKSRYLTWDGKRTKALVLIGDDIPHKKGDYHYNHPEAKIGIPDWRAEAKALKSHGVSIYPVQALGNRYATTFYQELADISGTPKLDLAQFAQMPQLLEAICYKQSNVLPEFEALLKAKATERIDLSLLNNIDKLAGRGVRGLASNKIIYDDAVDSKKKFSMRTDGLVAVHPSRFQILSVPAKTPIKDFVVSEGLTFKPGRGFYEFVKREEVQENKEVVLQDKTTGEMFTGDKAREILGVPRGTRGKVNPGDYKNFRMFIQSTSNNRNLDAGTNFLYEVEGLA
jgi:hypothetical protein